MVEPKDSNLLPENQTPDLPEEENKPTAAEISNEEEEGGEEGSGGGPGSGSADTETPETHQWSEDDFIKQFIDDVRQYDPKTYTGVQWLYYLLELWTPITVTILQPVIEHKFPPEIIDVEGGLPIMDYGDQMIIGRVKLWEKASRSSIELASSFDIMLVKLLSREVTEIVVDGLEKDIKRLWIDYSRHDVNVVNFQPTLEDLETRARVWQWRNRTLAEDAKKAINRSPG